MSAASFFVESQEGKSSPWLRGLWTALILLLAGLFCTGIMGGAAGVSRQGWESVWSYRDVFWKGWLLTILISLLSLLVSGLIGLGVALARRSRACFRGQPPPDTADGAGAACAGGGR